MTDSSRTEALPLPADAALREFAKRMDALTREFNALHAQGKTVRAAVVRAEATDRRLTAAAHVGPEEFGRVVAAIYGELTTPTESDVARLAGLISARTHGSTPVNVAAVLNARLAGQSFDACVSVPGAGYIYGASTPRRWVHWAVELEPRFGTAFGVTRVSFDVKAVPA